MSSPGGYQFLDKPETPQPWHVTHNASPSRSAREAAEARRTQVEAAMLVGIGLFFVLALLFVGVILGGFWHHA